MVSGLMNDELRRIFCVAPVGLNKKTLPVRNHLVQLCNLVLSFLEHPFVLFPNEKG
jgi:hypothetical protein